MATSKREQIEALREEAKRTLGQLLTEDQTQVVFGAGNPDTDMMLVGEAPGPQEDAEGVPFVGTSGQTLNEALVELGIDREDLWISNVVKVWPNKRENGSLRTRTPYAAEREASRTFFERELEIIAPRVMVLLGGTAAKEVLNDRNFKVTTQRGQWFEGPHGIPTIATYHPAYIVRMGGFGSERAEELLHEFKADLKAAAIRAGLLSDDQ